MGKDVDAEGTHKPPSFLWVSSYLLSSVENDLPPAEHTSKSSVPPDLLSILQSYLSSILRANLMLCSNCRLTKGSSLDQALCSTPSRIIATPSAHNPLTPR